MIFTLYSARCRFILVVIDGGREEQFEFGHPEAAIAWLKTLRRLA